MQKYLALLSVPVILCAAACTVDKDYNAEAVASVSKDITIFQDGLEIPVGKTEQLHVSDVLKIASDTTISKILKTDKNGDYYLGTDGSNDLSEVISEMDLKKLLDINGVSLSENLQYDLGSFTKDQFKIQGNVYKYDIPPFESFSLDNIVIPPISSGEIKINTEVYKFKPSDLNIGDKMPTMNHPVDLLPVSDIKQAVSLLPGAQDAELDIQPILENLNYSNIEITDFQERVQAQFSLGDNASKIADVKNFILKSGGKLKVSLSVENCPLTSGSLIPNINLDLSSIFKVSGAAQNGDIDLSGLVMKPSNSWKAEKEFSINAFADNIPVFSGGALKIDKYIDLSGTVCISAAKTSKAKVASFGNQNMILRAVVSFGNLIIDRMDITLGSDVGYSIDPSVMDLNFEFDLPKEVKSVEKIILDEDKPLKLEMQASNLAGITTTSGTGYLSICPTVELSFPEGLAVKGAVNNKITVTGDLHDGKISVPIVLQSLKPYVQSSKLKYSGKIVCNISAVAKGTFSSNTLPDDAAHDVVVGGIVSGQPIVKDFEAKVNSETLQSSFDEKNSFSVTMKGIGDFGTFRIYPKESTRLKLEIAMPTLTELGLVGKNIHIGIPSIFSVDGSQISGFNPSDNSITINGTIPEKIEIPVKYLDIKPEKGEGDEYIVKGDFVLKGAVSVTGEDVSNTTFKEIKDTKISVTFTIPTIEAGSVALNGDFEKSLDYECKDVVILDKTSIASLPKELKTLKKIDFDSVSATVQLTLDGLPSGGDFYIQNMSIKLPEFLLAHDGTNVIKFDKNIKVENNRPVVTKALMGGIENVSIEGITELKGDIALEATLFTERPNLDITTLKEKITGTVKVAVGNGSTVFDPGKIALAKVVANAQYDLTESQKVQLGNIPAELQAEDVNFALNPALNIELKTNFGAPLNGEFEIVPVIKDVPQEDVKVVIKGVKMPVSDDGKTVKSARYLICSNPETSDPDVVPIACDLSPLVKRIPDELILNINAKINREDECVIFPAAEYSCKMDYNFNVPLSFGKDFSLNLSSLITLDSEIGDYLTMGPVLLKMGVANTLPLGVNCELKLLDDNSKEIMLKTPVVFEIKPCEGTAKNPQTFQVALDLSGQKDVKVGFISLLFHAAVVDGVCVSNDQYIQVTNLTATLPKGATVSL